MKIRGKITLSFFVISIIPILIMLGMLVFNALSVTLKDSLGKENIILSSLLLLETPIAISLGVFLLAIIIFVLIIFKIIISPSKIQKEREIDKTKTEFLSLAFHKLRSPLSVIGWYTEILLSEGSGKINKDQKQFLNEIYLGNKRMVMLVNDLLNVFYLELGTFSVDPSSISITKISKSVLSQLEPSIEEKKIKVKTVFPGRMNKVIADPSLIKIILENILSNAVKYTKKKGEISVKVSKVNTNILIQVKDNGMGIPKRQQKKIFEKLFRADNVKRADTQGTGLGLYIAKSILDAVGGKIWFKSEVNKGTTFNITIPLSGMKPKKGTGSLG